MNSVIVSCMSCGQVLDVAGPHDCVALTRDTAYTVCTRCGEFVELDDQATRRVRLARLASVRDGLAAGFGR